MKNMILKCYERYDSLSEKSFARKDKGMALIKYTLIAEK